MFVQAAEVAARRRFTTVGGLRSDLWQDKSRPLLFEGYHSAHQLPCVMRLNLLMPAGVVTWSVLSYDILASLSQYALSCKRGLEMLYFCKIGLFKMICPFTWNARNLLVTLTYICSSYRSVLQATSYTRQFKIPVIILYVVFCSPVSSVPTQKLYSSTISDHSNHLPGYLFIIC